VWGNDAVRLGVAGVTIALLQRSNLTIVAAQTMRCAEDHSCDRSIDIHYEIAIAAVYTHELADRCAEKFVMWVA